MDEQVQKPGNNMRRKMAFLDTLKLGAFWHTEFGPLNQGIHVYSYDHLQQHTAVRAALAQDTARQQLPGGRDLDKDLNERARVREASRQPGELWPPQTGVRPVRQENTPLMPAAFSPVRETSVASIPRQSKAGRPAGRPYGTAVHSPGAERAQHAAPLPQRAVYHRASPGSTRVGSAPVLAAATSPPYPLRRLHEPRGACRRAGRTRG